MSNYLPLNPRDEIRIIAPSQSRRSGQESQYRRAQERLEGLGYTVSFGVSVKSMHHLGTATPLQRARDFNDAFADKNVKAVMAINGGWSANEILPLIDWQLVTSNPKPLIGFSDITVLLNAIYAKTGNVSYLGPNFGTLGYMQSWQYTLNNFAAMLRQDSPIRLTRSQEWGVQKSDHFKTKPWKVLAKGKAEAILLGGNLGTFYLLQGTEYQPQFDEPFIFALEDDDEAGKYSAREVSRRFESLLQLPNFRQNLCGLLIGRFQQGSKVSERAIESIIASKKLTAMPIISGVDFGHTLPMVTLPIGGIIKLCTEPRASLEIV
jgi:muramoyltetrapeptide carboxypeptidase